MNCGGCGGSGFTSRSLAFNKLVLECFYLNEFEERWEQGRNVDKMVWQGVKDRFLRKS